MSQFIRILADGSGLKAASEDEFMHAESGHKPPHIEAGVEFDDHHQVTVRRDPKTKDLILSVSRSEKPKA